jgi:transcriptional antiterminator NusG
MTTRWYAVHAYSNFERKVAESIREQAKQRGLSDLFEEILVPIEKVVEVRRGRKVEGERKLFPGYVLVKMDLTDEAYHLIKNTPKVTGFLGSDNKPMPLPDAEAQLLIRQMQRAPGSRSLCRSSAVQRRLSWSSRKSRSYKVHLSPQAGGDRGRRGR